ncbi:MAG: hypothetical protein ACTMUB_02030 [cyanobacterium endosymbiont of Rhopalodia musculus]
MPILAKKDIRTIAPNEIGFGKSARLDKSKFTYTPGLVVRR